MAVVAETGLTRRSWWTRARLCPASAGHLGSFECGRRRTAATSRVPGSARTYFIRSNPSASAPAQKHARSAQPARIATPSPASSSLEPHGRPRLHEREATRAASQLVRRTQPCDWVLARSCPGSGVPWHPVVVEVEVDPDHADRIVGSGRESSLFMSAGLASQNRSGL